MMRAQIENLEKSRAKNLKSINTSVNKQLGLEKFKNLKELRVLVDTKIDSNTKNLSEAKAKIENRKLETIYNGIKSQTGILKNYKKKINKYLVEINKKISMPFACIIFMLIGTPIGVMSKKGGIAQGAVTSILFFLIYYVFLIGGEELADMAIISPFIAMWAPNFLLLGVGIYLIYTATYELRSFDILDTLNIFKKIKNRKGTENVSS